MSYQIWDGDLYLFTVYTRYEADEHTAMGFQVLQESNANLVDEFTI